ncbi:AMME syndrome candidate gene 1 protein [Dirofilaria immitis]|nr:AMME syndrome candidate gene 1 protein [Dirofilaria immitis]
MSSLSSGHSSTSSMSSASTDLSSCNIESSKSKFEKRHREHYHITRRLHQHPVLRSTITVTTTYQLEKKVKHTVFMLMMVLLLCSVTLSQSPRKLFAASYFHNVNIEGPNCLGLFILRICVLDHKRLKLEPRNERPQNMPGHISGRIASFHMTAYCFDVLYAVLRNHQAPKIPPTIPNEKFPLFVTWKKGYDRRLRGCIGTFTNLVLHKGLHEYAIIRINDCRNELIFSTCLGYNNSFSIAIEYDWDL